MISSCRRGTSSADTTYRDPLAREDDTGLRSSIAGARRAWYGARHEPDQPQHTHGIPHTRAAPGRIPARCRLRYRLLHSRAGRAHGGAGRVLGVDIDREWVQYARRRDEGRASYAVADARALPFQTGSFDLVVSITALCFILEELVALRKILRVTRRRFAIGLLNRRSLLWLRKGRRGGFGSYRGARWHTVREARALFRELPVQRLAVQTAVQVPSGGAAGQLLERMCPSAVPTGGFLLVAGDVVDEGTQVT
jgi:hypothetical protein